MSKRLYSAKRQKFRELLKQARLGASLTQMELAARLRRHQSYVSDYERGHRRLDWVAVEEILTACQYELAKFAREYIVVTKSLSD